MERQHAGRCFCPTTAARQRRSRTASEPRRGDRHPGFSYRGYDRPWATVSNTPWRLHKVTCYEGGISTPLVARWPAGIPADRVGSLVRQPGHVIDLLPSFLELAGAPATGGPPLEGQSIVPMLEGRPGVADRTFFWEHEGNRAIRSGKWMLVSLPGPKHAFELYDIDADRIQAHNLAASEPDVARRLEQQYGDWAKRVGVIPWSEIQARMKAERR